MSARVLSLENVFFFFFCCVTVFVTLFGRGLLSRFKRLICFAFVGELALEFPDQSEYFIFFTIFYILYFLQLYFL